LDGAKRHAARRLGAGHPKVQGVATAQRLEAYAHPAPLADDEGPAEQPCETSGASVRPRVEVEAEFDRVVA